MTNFCWEFRKMKFPLLRVCKMIEIGRYCWTKVNIFLIVSVKLNAYLFNSAVAQNKEHLLEMLKRQSESTLYKLIEFYTVKIQNMHKICKKYTNMQKCCKICENMQKCKNNNMQIFKFFQADNRFQRARRFKKTNLLFYVIYANMQKS